MAPSLQTSLTSARLANKPKISGYQERLFVRLCFVVLFLYPLHGLVPPEGPGSDQRATATAVPVVSLAPAEPRTGAAERYPCTGTLGEHDPIPPIGGSVDIPREGARIDAAPEARVAPTPWIGEGSTGC